MGQGVIDLGGGEDTGEGRMEEADRFVWSEMEIELQKLVEARLWTLLSPKF